MKQENDKIIFVDENGNKTELVIYFSHVCKERNKKYVIFYDPIFPTDLIAGVVEEDGLISDIEDDEEYDYLDQVIADYEENRENK